MLSIRIADNEINRKYLMLSEKDEQYFEKNKDKLTKNQWTYISSYIRLSEEFIEKFMPYLSWNLILRCQPLSLAFIKKYEEDINWYELSGNRSLTDEIIDEYRGKIHWGRMSFSKGLAYSTIIKNVDKLNMNDVKRNLLYLEKLTPEQKDEVRKICELSQSFE